MNGKFFNQGDINNSNNQPNTGYNPGMQQDMNNYNNPQYNNFNQPNNNFNQPINNDYGQNMNQGMPQQPMMNNNQFNQMPQDNMYNQGMPQQPMMNNQFNQMPQNNMYNQGMQQQPMMNNQFNQMPQDNMYNQGMQPNYNNQMSQSGPQIDQPMMGNQQPVKNYKFFGFDQMPNEQPDALDSNVNNPNQQMSNLGVFNQFVEENQQNQVGGYVPPQNNMYNQGMPQQPMMNNQFNQMPQDNMYNQGMPQQPMMNEDYNQMPQNNVYEPPGQGMMNNQIEQPMMDNSMEPPKPEPPMFEKKPKEKFKIDFKSIFRDKKKVAIILGVSLVLIIILTILLSSSGTKTLNCTKEEKLGTIKSTETYIIKFKKNKLKDYKYTAVYTYETEDDAKKEEALKEEIAKDKDSIYKSYNIKRSNKTVTLRASYDIDKLQEDSPLSYKSLQSDLEKNGATCK